MAHEGSGPLCALSGSREPIARGPPGEFPQVRAAFPAGRARVERCTRGVLLVDACSWQETPLQGDAVALPASSRCWYGLRVVLPPGGSASRFLLQDQPAVLG